MKLFRLIFFSAVFFHALFASAQGIEKYIPAPSNPPKLVNDYLNLLSSSQVEALERKLVAYDDSTSNQIAVVTIGEIGDYDINDYAVALGRKWGVGGKEFSNGIIVIILVDKERQKRKVWIAVGYGLEGAIPDITAKKIIDNDIIPNFKANDIYRGLDEGTDDLISAAKGEYKAPEGYRNRGDDGGIPVWLIILVVVIVLIIMSSNRRGGGGMMSRRGYRRWDNNVPPIWFPSGGGGWGGGGSSGGGGFGGFGGGSFGGGGAGGDW